MKAQSLRFILFSICVCISITCETKDGFEITTRALTEYLKTGVRPSYLDYALNQCPLPAILRTEPEEGSGIVDEVICTLCNLVADILIMERRMGMSDVQMAGEASYFCQILKIEDERVCDGVIKNNVDIFTYIMDTNPDLSGSRICRLLLRTNNCGSGDDYEWTIEVPEGKTIDKVQGNASTSFNILHISDIHYDPLYTPGKTNQCREPVCCQDDQEDGVDAGTTCGYWSDYTYADVPFHTMQEALRQTTTHEFDYVYYTGDIVSHRVWSTSIENNTRDIIAVTEQFKKYYDVPVYPVIGNHESHPVNVFSSDNVDGTISTQWVFDLVAEQWGEWLSEDAKTTILKGGYYTVSPRKGLRVIALNSNLCYITNWWLINDSKDPHGQLAWLAGVLLEAEKNKESVHILMHLPTGNGECLDTWSREYRKLVRRFSNTITGQFAGHTHRDQLSVFYDEEDESRGISVMWNGASVTPYSKANPSYKLYQIDTETFDVLDLEEWTFNLTSANLEPTKDVGWYKLYSFKDAFGVDSLQAEDVTGLITKMTKDHSLIQKYYIYKFRNSDVAVREGCDESCEKALLCDMVTTTYGDTQQCERIQKLYDENKSF
ncbi:hypothetical protein NQ315_007746 [Exocentrus adspersus]|uniref:Sphingomyelin phosphodiesterase n=1 Tax=Exocentrus adspersus TaxID=1586481 RepID=A0AAV8W807_9CUCU|nr:hypothetical protein NQ315_007746 [Exocentrus adspersus]